MAWDEDEYYDEEREERERYDAQYTGVMDESLKGVEDEDDREAIFQELRQLRYDPSNKPGQDAMLNFLKAKNAAMGKKKRLSGAAKSYAQFIAQRDGLSTREAQKKAKKMMRKGGNE